MLITSLVMSRFDYCSSIYHGLPNNLMINISRIIRTSTRIIYRQRLSDYTSVSKRMVVVEYLIFNRNLYIEYCVSSIKHCSIKCHVICMLH